MAVVCCSTWPPRFPLPPCVVHMCLVMPPYPWGVAAVLLAQLLWLGWPCAAPPPPLLRALRPIPFGVGVICDFFFFFFCFFFLYLQGPAWYRPYDIPFTVIHAISHG